MDFDEALGYMQGRLRLGMKLGNERFLALLHRLGDPQECLRVIHIAGTKGKGSTTAMAANVLREAGHTVGMYLSPYVYDVRERVQINGEMISRADFARWVSDIRPHVVALEETEHGATTEFELKTAVGLCYFAERAVDYAVLEVGLGGRLDATNVVTRPLMTVITNIGLDHTELLGETLGEIAAEKAGIVKPGVPCVTGVPVGGEAWEVIARICKERGVPLIPVPSPELGADGLTLTTPKRTLAGVRLELRGAFQAVNAAAALYALDAAAPSELPPVSDEVARHGLETAWVPGRLEQVRDKPDGRRGRGAQRAVGPGAGGGPARPVRRGRAAADPGGRPVPAPRPRPVPGPAGRAEAGPAGRDPARLPPAPGTRRGGGRPPP